MPLSSCPMAVSCTMRWDRIDQLNDQSFGVVDYKSSLTCNPIINILNGLEFSIADLIFLRIQDLKEYQEEQGIVFGKWEIP